MSQPGSQPVARAAPAARADSTRNRERIHAAARELFAMHGSYAVQFEDIAERAGVARATLFRHIGSKDALVLEIYSERLRDIEALAATALAVADPWDGFASMIHTLVAWMHEDRGLYDFISVALRQGTYAIGESPFLESVDAVIARAQREGPLWFDLRTRDLLPLLTFAAWVEEPRLDGLTEMLLRGLHTSTADLPRPEA